MWSLKRIETRLGQKDDHYYKKEIVYSHSNIETNQKEGLESFQYYNEKELNLRIRK